MHGDAPKSAKKQVFAVFIGTQLALDWHFNSLHFDSNSITIQLPEVAISKNLMGPVPMSANECQFFGIST